MSLASTPHHVSKLQRRAVAIGAHWIVFASFAASSAQADTFWDRWQAARDLLARRPAAAIAHAESLFARDPDDPLARWLTGTIAARDTSKSAPERVSAAGPPRAGDWVALGAFASARSRWEESRGAYGQARAAYDSTGRPADASRVSLWRALRGAEGGDRAAAEADLDSAEALARRSGDVGALADVLVYRGERDMRRSVAAARKRFEEAAKLLADLSPGGQHVTVHRNLGGALNRAGESEGAEHHYREARRLALALGDTVQAVRSLAGVGLVRRAQARYAEAVAIARDVLDQSLAHGSPNLVANGWHDLGTATEESGRHVEARNAFLECTRALEKHPRPPDNLAVSLDALGGVEITLGLHDDARRHLERAASLCRERGLASTHCYVLLHQADLHRELGDVEAAARFADEGLVVARRAGVERVESVLLSLRARLHNLAGRSDSALAVARRGQVLARRVERRNLWRLMPEEAHALHRLGRLNEGLAVLDTLEALLPEVPDTSQLGHARLLRARLLLSRGDATAALAAARSGREIAASLASPGRVADARLVLGEALLAASRPMEAAVELDAGLAWFESIQSALRAGEERSAYQARWYDSYVLLAQAQASATRPDRAFETLERSRARELRRQVASQSGLQRTGLPATLARELERIEAGLVREQARLLAQYSRPPGRREPGLASVERRVDSLRSAWSVANRRAERAAPRWAREAGLRSAVSAGTLRRALGGHRAVLAFLAGSERQLVFLVRDSAVDVRVLELSEDSLANAVAAHVACLRRAASAMDCGSATLARQLLPEPAKCAGVTSLFVLADGPLAQLPFETLPWRDRPLIGSLEVAYAASATLLLDASPPGIGVAPLVAFGDPDLGPSAPSAAENRDLQPALARLPHAAREARAIGAMHPRSRVYLGAEATEPRFYAEAAQASHLHVAAHALADDRRPEFSGLVLARGDTTGGAAADGLAQAWEIAAHRIPARLVTLSACETAGGGSARGEGLRGLARAFRIAGARELVVSLWQVGDATAADLMERFYGEMAKGSSPATALRAAKLAAMAGELGTPVSTDADAARGVASVAAQGSARPRAWAAFVLIGALD